MCARICTWHSEHHCVWCRALYGLICLGVFCQSEYQQTALLPLQWQELSQGGEMPELQSSWDSHFQAYVSPVVSSAHDQYLLSEPCSIWNTVYIYGFITGVNSGLDCALHFHWSSHKCSCGAVSMHNNITIELYIVISNENLAGSCS